MGRQSTYTPELAATICERISDGEPLAVICRTEGMPHPSTFRDWCDKNESLAIAYARAREVGFDAIATECLDIADDKSGDVKFVGGDDGEREVCNTEFVQRAKLRIETRLKLLAKWDPKRYGDKMDVKHEGDVGLTVTVKRFTPEPAPSGS